MVVAIFMGGIVVRNALAQAQPGAADASAGIGARVVDVTILAGGGEADPLMDTIREVFGRLGLAVNAHLVTNPENAADSGASSTGLSVRIDLASRYEATMVVRNDVVEVRRTISRNASPSIVREEIADAVRSAVESQLLPSEARPAPPVATIESSAPVAPPPPMPPVVEVPAPKAEDRWFALDLTTFAGAGSVASGSLVAAHVGGGVVLGSRRGHRPSLAVTASYVPFTASYVPFESSLGKVTAPANIVAIRAVPAIEIVHASWIAVNVGAGGGVDIIALRPSATQPPPPLKLKVENVRTGFDPIATALATVDVGLAPGVAFTLVVGSDFDLLRNRYVVQNLGSDQEFLNPWVVRPLALAGFTFTAVGAGLFAARTTP